MIDDGFSLIEITEGVQPSELMRISLGQRITLPTGDLCSFDKVNLTTDSAAPRVFKIVARKINGELPSNMYTRDQTTVAYDAQNNQIVETRTFKLKTNAELLELAKAKARALVLNEIIERNGTEWNTYRLAVRQRVGELRAAFLNGDVVNIDTGTINGSGGWPS